MIVPKSKRLYQSKRHFPELFPQHSVIAVLRNLDHKVPSADRFQRQQNLEHQRNIRGVIVWFQATHGLDRDAQMCQVGDGGQHCAGLWPQSAVVRELPEVGREAWRVYPLVPQAGEGGAEFHAVDLLEAVGEDDVREADDCRRAPEGEDVGAV
jgi:hypothetical protein